MFPPRALFLPLFLFASPPFMGLPVCMDEQALRGHGNGFGMEEYPIKLVLLHDGLSRSSLESPPTPQLLLRVHFGKVAVSSNGSSPPFEGPRLPASHQNDNFFYFFLFERPCTSLRAVGLRSLLGFFCSLVLPRAPFASQLSPE